MGCLTADQELKRNGSGYYDPTAYKALRNIEREANRMEYKRGEIFKYNTTGGLYQATKDVRDIISTHYF